MKLQIKQNLPPSPAAWKSSLTPLTAPMTLLPYIARYDFLSSIARVRALGTTTCLRAGESVLCS